MNNDNKKDAAAKTLGDYTSVLRRRWRYPAFIIPAALLLAIFIAYVLPVSYRSVSTIMLEPSSLPANVAPTMATNASKDTTVTADQQLELTRRRVMDKESLLALVKEINPYPHLKDVSPAVQASFITADTSFEPVDPVTFEPLPNSTSFSILYQNPDPKLAAAVNEKLAALFLTYNQRTRAEQAAEAYRFLHTQSQELVSSMEGMERKLAQFKTQYGDALPDAQNRNLMGVDRSQRDLSDIERDIRDAEGEEGLLELQIKEVSPSLIAAVGDWRTEVAKMRAELALAEQKYTAQHPDVKRLRRAIADLAAQGGASGSATGARPDNPEYLRVESQLKAKRRELAALRATASRLRGDLFGYEKNLSTAPNVEREYLQLSREYESAQSRYQDLQQKMKQAALVQTLESEARGERFTLIRPASVPAKPFSPNRLGIILIGVVLGGGLAVLLAVLRDAADPTVRSADDLEEVLDVAPVGAIPVMLNSVDLRQRRRMWSSVSAAYAVALVVVVLTVLFAH